MPKIFFITLSLFLVACDQANTTSDNHLQDHHVFIGCYSTQKNTPAQILIDDHDGQMTMAMKEPDGSWDTPEPMKVLNQGQTWDFFKTNGLNLGQTDILTSIGRVDDVMALGYLKEGLPAVNPHLDSQFVIGLFGAVNTIYKMECDKTPVQFEMPKDIHGKPVSIKNGG